MATVFFYEKPGCVNNTRQKKLLVAAGHQVIARNLLTENWTTERLRSFFSVLPVRDWFNYSAPAIKLGEINPENMSEQEALAVLVDNPLLIRRPLMQVDDSLMAGFNQDAVHNWIGLTGSSNQSDLESCSRPLNASCASHE